MRRFALICTVMLIVSSLSLSAYALKDDTKSKSSKGKIVESGVEEVDMRARGLYQSVWVGGDQSKGGWWYFGNMLGGYILSELQTPYWNNRTSIQSGDGAPIHTSGFVGVGRFAGVYNLASFFGGNKCFYDLKAP